MVHDQTPHQHIHAHELSPDLSLAEHDELTRRQMVAKMLGITTAIFTPGFLTACGELGLKDDDGNTLPPAAAEGQPNVLGPATATEQAERLNPPKPQEPILMVEPGSFIVDGDRNLRIVSYSFDDTPGVRVIREIMNICDQEGAPGAMGVFAVGIYMNANTDVTQEIVSRGYNIHSHSMTHRYDIPTNISEIDPMQQTIKHHTGKTNKIFRNPGGYVNQTLLNYLRSRGMFYLWTSVDLGDWRSPRPSSDILLQRHNNALSPGRHFLLHASDSHGTTPSAFRGMLRSARANGFQVVSPQDHMSIGNPTERALSLIESQLQIQESYVAEGRFKGISELEANWIITLETSLYESKKLPKDSRELLEFELKQRKKALGIL